MIFTKKKSKNSLSDFVLMRNKTGHVFVDILNDLGDSVESGVHNWPPLMLMAYAYARRAATSALYIQGIIGEDIFDHVKVIFKGIQIKTGVTPEFQEAAFSVAMEFMKKYNSGITNIFIKKLVKLSEDYEASKIKLSDRELFESVLETLSFEKTSSSDVYCSDELMNWARSHDIHDIYKTTEIDLSCKKINYFPKEFFSLVHLEKIHLSHNNIELLPDEFCKFINLKYLDLRRNHLKTLPRSFFALQKLEFLDLSFNDFSNLPDEIVFLPNLPFIDISGNANLKLNQLQKSWVESHAGMCIIRDEDLLSI